MSIFAPLSRLGRGILAVAAAALVSAQAAPARPPAPARPALWAVSDPDTTIYLFGTIHLLPEGAQWRSTTFDKAVAGSDQLVVETMVDEKDPSKVMGALAQLAFSQNLPPLTERVSKDKRPALEAAIKRSGFPPQGLDRMESWAAAVMLMGGQFADLGLKVDKGVESTLRGEFEGRGKPVGELETNVEQFGFFDRLPESAQRTLLEGAIEQGPAFKQTFDSMMRAWAAGDVKRIAHAFNEDMAKSPELADHLIFQRNANWARWIENRLAQPGTILVAVGAGHLAGRKSVIDLLERQGFKVRRIQ